MASAALGVELQPDDTEGIDRCQFFGDEPSVSLTVATGADPVAEFDHSQGIDERLIQTTFGTVVGKTSVIGCTLTWAQERVGQRTAGSDHYVVELMVDSDCGSAVDTADTLHAALTKPVEPPAAPDTLGFEPGEPDEPLPPECQIYHNVEDDGACRTARQVDVPASTDAIIGGSCRGATADHRIEAQLGWDKWSTVANYQFCTQALMDFAGHPGVLCPYEDKHSHREFVVSLWTDADKAGVLVASIQLWPPRGTLGDPRSRRDESTDIDTIIERALTRYF